MVSGVLGICVPVASVCGTYVVALFAGNDLLMFLAPCGLGAVFILWFVAVLPDRRLAPADRAPWSLGLLVSTFYVAPRRNPDFAWAFLSRFLFVMAYAFLTSYLAFYLLEELESTEADVPDQIFTATLVTSAMVVLASLIGGRLSDRVGRRKVFVATAALLYAAAMFAVAFAGDFDALLVGLALSGLGFGIYVAVDLALVTDVLTDPSTVAKDLGVFNIANALPYSVAPALAPLVLLLGGGDYSWLYVGAGVCALGSAVAILPVRAVR